MKICVAQTKSVKGDVLKNIENHLKFIELALAFSADLIIFPELSLTGYEPELAGKMLMMPGCRFSRK
jgi:predicted amidohydrolase